jgi:hypothetical protein
LKKDLSKNLEKIHTLVTKEKKFSKDKAYEEWKNDFLKKKQKKDSAKEEKK